MARAGVGDLLSQRDGPVEVSCLVEEPGCAGVIFLATADDLLQRLEETGHIGGDDHPNKLELQAQRALLQHCIQHRVVFRLHDDHWGRTGLALRGLFEQGKAIMQIDDKAYLFSDVMKEQWRSGTDPSLRTGGFLYRDAAGAVIYKQQTWLS